MVAFQSFSFFLEHFLKHIVMKKNEGLTIKHILQRLALAANGNFSRVLNFKAREKMKKCTKGPEDISNLFLKECAEDCHCF